MPLSLDLTDTTALVTGGTRGIGRSIVDALAEAGAKVAFTYRSSTETADALVAELTERGTEAFAIQGDTADPEHAQAAVDAVTEPADAAQRTSANGEFVQAVARKNVEFTLDAIRERSQILRELEEAGDIRLVGAMYHVETGAVEFL